MIRPLRQRHRMIISLLALVLPVAFIFALAARKRVPRMQDVPASLRGNDATLPQTLFEREDLWPDLSITTRLLADQHQPAKLAVELHPQEALAAPDILVYWRPRDVEASAASLAQAYLLGTLGGRQKRSWYLPEAARTTEGELILYSLGHQTILATAPLAIPQGGRTQ